MEEHALQVMEVERDGIELYYFNTRFDHPFIVNISSLHQYH